MWAEVPEWLCGLMSEKFFNACIIHEDAKKNEKNIFCLDCCEGICHHCLTHHRSHSLLQIRRYVYHDVVRLKDADKLMDCAHVQSYTNNSEKVIFLNQRPRSRLHKAPANCCINCDRNLQDSYLFCSLCCKLQHILRTGCKLSKYLRNFEFLALAESGLYYSHMTPDSVLEPACSLRTDSGSVGGSAAGLSKCPALICTATTEVARKKRSTPAGLRSAFRPACRPVSEINRRKGTPHRSPLH